MGKAILFLKDGTVFWGESFGKEGETIGEVVFNTGMVGYQEILTDPSYYEQIVLLTYPLIGNYGINFSDDESQKIYAKALIVKKLHKSSNWRSQKELDEYLKSHDVMGFSEIDTRRLVLHIRNHGSMMAILSSRDFDINSLKKKLDSAPNITGRDIVKDITTPSIYEFDEIVDFEYIDFPKIPENRKVPLIAVYDMGIKRNILRYLRSIAQKVIVFPANTSAKEVLSYNPSAIFISNGPGDPAPITYAIENIKRILKDTKLPLFGICLGHQLLSLALGGKTYKLKFGHHGINHPIKNLLNGKVEITSQNHNFCVDLKSLSQDNIRITHINLNDNTLEGLELKDKPVFSVQYHPESAPGPNDANYLFMKFYKLIKGEGKDA